ncbi:MAG: hypothetical protein BGO07_00950 [Alphaproteobacteria bacterium 40-19]|nr:MAG: hypothetical protein BGO07_00950 [Alphaproteobacteria bacterium 40-19]
MKKHEEKIIDFNFNLELKEVEEEEAENTQRRLKEYSMYTVAGVPGIHAEVVKILSCRVRDSQIKTAYQEGNIERCQAIRSIFPECDHYKGWLDGHVAWLHKGQESSKEDGVLLESFLKEFIEKFQTPGYEKEKEFLNNFISVNKNGEMEWFECYKLFNEQIANYFKRSTIQIQCEVKNNKNSIFFELNKQEEYLTHGDSIWKINILKNLSYPKKQEMQRVYDAVRAFYDRNHVTWDVLYAFFLEERSKVRVCCSIFKRS